jgi:CHAD domain-containing protein
MLHLPTAAYALPDGADPPALLSLLGERFPLVPEPTARLTCTVLDTADRRLRAAGFDLELDSVGGDNRLVLRNHGGGAPVTAHPPRLRARRYLLGDVPAGPLRDHLAPIVEMRALLPLARVRIDAQPVRVLGREDKTVARLTVTNRAALDVAREPVPLTPRVEVTGVLGYAKAFARLLTVLSHEAGLAEAPGSPADEAIAAAGGDPEGIRTSVRVDLRPAQRTDRAAVAVLTDLAGMVEANLPGALGDVDSEFLHDLRVAVRRSRSVLRELKGAFPADALATQREALRWIQAVTGPTRDLDVQLLDWDHLVVGVPIERQASLGPVRALLVRQRADAFRALVRQLRGAAFRRAWDGYREFLAGDLGPARDRPDAKRPLAAVAGGRIRQVYRRMVTMGQAIDDTSPAERLHELRKRGKELRYLLELFGELWPPRVVKPMVRSLKGLQDVLGVHQDREVQAERLRALADELAGAADGPAALLTLGVLIDGLEAEQRKARGAFAERFAAFAADGQRQLVARTFTAPRAMRP